MNLIDHNALRKAYWILREQLGIDPRKLLRAPVGLFRYARDWWRFRASNKTPMHMHPCLHDWWEQAGAVSSEYFWQDLIVARMIHAAAPVRHIDVGSRLDGFVAHLASFRDVEVFDIRPLDIRIPGVTFRQVDLMRVEALPASCADSLSCLHAIEHFGLGRYGDPLNARGVELGLASLATLLEPEGVLYLSVPYGPDAVHFNAHRTLQPATVADMASALGLRLKACWLFDNVSKAFIAVDNVSAISADVARTASLSLFVFQRQSTTNRDG